MARIARVIAAGIPHHITQRGNRRMQTFFGDDDYRAYIALLAEWYTKCRVEIWAYCLVIAVPENEDALRFGIGEAHRRYSRMINFRQNWRGHLWQGRFASFPRKHLGHSFSFDYLYTPNHLMGAMGPGLIT